VDILKQQAADTAGCSITIDAFASELNARADHFSGWNLEPVSRAGLKLAGRLFYN
jgi:hypothetical protein